MTLLLVALQRLRLPFSGVDKDVFFHQDVVIKLEPARNLKDRISTVMPWVQSFAMGHEGAIGV
jgi:hypothetical protein